LSDVLFEFAAKMARRLLCLGAVINHFFAQGEIAMKKMILILLGLMFVSTTVLSVGCSHEGDDDDSADDDDDSAAM